MVENKLKSAKKSCKGRFSEPYSSRCNDKSYTSDQKTQQMKTQNPLSIWTLIARSWQKS